MLVLHNWPFPITFNYKQNPFLLDVISPSQSINAILELRYEVFCQELGYIVTPIQNIEVDEYDHYCDHLVVKDINTDTVVATYRLLRADVADLHCGFYSESEFDLTLFKHQVKFLEASRACIKENYRHQFIISFLWKALIMYMEYYGLQYIGGCTSIGCHNVELAMLIYAYTKKLNAFLPPEFGIVPHEHNRVPGFTTDFLIENFVKAKRALPSLLRSYLNIGAQLSSDPAQDKSNVIDFFTLVSLPQVSERTGDFLWRI